MKLIEKYFSGNISKEEFVQLEKLIIENEDVKKEFYTQLELQKTITEIKRKPIKDRFEKLDKKSQSNSKRYFYAVAATVSILIAVGSMFYYNSSTDYEDLYTSNFQAYPNVITLSNRGENKPDDIAGEAFVFYGNKEYEKAAQSFNNLYSLHKKDYLLFYYGVSLLANNNTQKGIQVLESYYTEKKSDDFTTKVYWYLGLAHMKLGKIKTAKQYLQKVAHSEDNFSNRANNLLEKLD